MADRLTLEDRLLEALGEVKRQISDLEAERRTLERLIIRARRDNVEKRDVTRSNSLGRVFVESLILDKLGSALEPICTTNALWITARAADLALKKTTFRSYIYRLKERGLIESPRYGEWQLTAVARQERALRTR